MLLACVTGCHQAPAGAPQPGASHVWVRLAAVPGRPAVAYLTLTGGDHAARLAGVTSPSVERIEMHQGGMAGGMMTMRPLHGVDLPAHGAHAFAPGGDHLMLFGVDPQVKPGGALTLTLTFAGAPPLAVTARVVAAGDPAPAD